jgi:hypothetical protein
MDIVCERIPLSELPTAIRAKRTYWQQGKEAALIVHGSKALGYIVPLAVLASLPIEAVAPMPLLELQAWLLSNRRGWLEGIMDALTLTHQAEDILAFVHPYYAKRLPVVL